MNTNEWRVVAVSRVVSIRKGTQNRFIGSYNNDDMKDELKEIAQGVCELMNNEVMEVES